MKTTAAIATMMRVPMMAFARPPPVAVASPGGGCVKKLRPWIAPTPLITTSTRIEARGTRASSTARAMRASITRLVAFRLAERPFISLPFRRGAGRRCS